MQHSHVIETSALSAHRREVALVRWSLLRVPERDDVGGGPLAGDSLRQLTTGRVPEHRDDW